MYLTPSAVKRQNFFRREKRPPPPPLPPRSPPRSPPPRPMPPPPPLLPPPLERSLLIAICEFLYESMLSIARQTLSPTGMSSSSDPEADTSSRTRRGGRSP